MSSRAKPDGLALGQAFQQLQVPFEQLIDQICHWLSLSLGQALQTLVHGAIHIDGKFSSASFRKNLPRTALEKSYSRFIALIIS